MSCKSKDGFFFFNMNFPKATSVTVIYKSKIIIIYYKISNINCNAEWTNVMIIPSQSKAIVRKFLESTGRALRYEYACRQYRAYSLNE